MDTCRLLLLVSMVMRTCGSSERPCLDLDQESFNLLEGEAFYFLPYALDAGDADVPDDEITWCKNKMENISADEKQSVHHHGGALLFLNLLAEDSGSYRARHEEKASGKCYNYYVEINVFKSSPVMDKELLYGEIKNSDINKKVPCPDPVLRTCETSKGRLAWSKDSSPLKGHNDEDLWIHSATEDHEGIYTCTCTWTHNGKEYKSSASRRLTLQEQSVHSPLQILSPVNKEQLADEGAETSLVCSVFCGTNVDQDCSASWHVDGLPIQETDECNDISKQVTKDPTKFTISTAILTIQKVSAKDFKTEFLCVGEGFYTTVNTTLTLKRRESIIPLVIGGVCVLFFCVLAAVLVKCFAVDLALCFRPCFRPSSCTQDGRVYDAYVVYQTQNIDKVTEDTLCQFVTRVLPSVLEEKGGYRLFIHGRDDIPGEDRMELVEERMKQSRRLMVILTPGSGSEPESSDQHLASPQDSEIGGFDWQVGLHRVLLQRDMSVILIQLGDTGPQGYTHLPAGLQHLILKSAPLRWPEGSRGAAAWNSRFWKRVRYLMPATPANKCPQSTII